MLHITRYKIWPKTHPLNWLCYLPSTLPPRDCRWLICVTVNSLRERVETNPHGRHFLLPWLSSPHSHQCPPTWHAHRRLPFPKLLTTVTVELSPFWELTGPCGFEIKPNRTIGFHWCTRVIIKGQIPVIFHESYETCTRKMFVCGAQGPFHPVTVIDRSDLVPQPLPLWS